MLDVVVQVGEPHITYALLTLFVATLPHMAGVATFITSHTATTIMGYVLPIPHAAILVLTTITTHSVLLHILIPVAAQHAREVALATQPLSMFISL